MKYAALLLAGLLSLMVSLNTHAGEPKIVQLSPDTYLVVVKNHAGIFGNPQTTKIKAIEAANAFAKKQGKIAIPLALESTPAGGPGHWPAAEYQFRVVAADDPEAGRTALLPRADITIEVKAPPAAAPVMPQPANAADEAKRLEVARGVQVWEDVANAAVARRAKEDAARSRGELFRCKDGNGTEYYAAQPTNGCVYIGN